MYSSFFLKLILTTGICEKKLILLATSLMNTFIISLKIKEFGKVYIYVSALSYLCYMFMCLGNPYLVPRAFCPCDKIWSRLFFWTFCFFILHVLLWLFGVYGMITRSDNDTIVATFERVWEKWAPLTLKSLPNLTYLVFFGKESCTDHFH